MGVLDDAIREHLELKRRHGAAEEDVRRQEAEALGPPRRQVAPDQAQQAEGTDGHEPVEAEAEPIADEAALPGMGGEHEPAGEQAHVEEPYAEEPHVEEPHAEVEEPHAEIEEPHTEIEEPQPSEEGPRGGEAALYEPPSEEHDLPLGLDDERAVAEDHELPFADAPRAETSSADADLPDTQESSAVRAGDTPPRGFEPLDDDDDLVGEEDESEDSRLAGGVSEDAEPEDDQAEGDDPDVLEDTPDFLQETPEHDRLWFEQKPPRDFDFD